MHILALQRRCGAEYPVINPLPLSEFGNVLSADAHAL